ncbi:ABC transporter ATP-binding protein [Komagataeibacter sp. FNDCF1]|uniref:ABC transporter ATP-binding protein n=1 Tax=Komagataeibacter sp. FNDCF1 TaxID=2878681 RepID=UPI001E3D11BB|nr:ABC transporter ATP-binding protein [Komagataeibacter sp. FNDCF1]MCE2565241.1 ABC transporter ATP-binding protein [Komagataeibacter sp. FNDCF1]
MPPLSSRLVVNALRVVPDAPPLSFHAAAGACLAVVNDHAACLSTLADVLAGHVPTQGGTIMVDGRDETALPPERRSGVVVGWRDPLFAHMSVQANLAFGPRARGMESQAVAARVRAILALLGLDGLEQARPAALEPEQALRVMIGRALVSEPPVLVLDDPFTPLPPAARTAMRRLVGRLARARGLCVVLLTRARSDALLLGDMIAYMSGMEIVQQGTALDLFERPACDRVAAGFGHANSLTVRVACVEDDVARAHLPGGLPVEAMAMPGVVADRLATLCIRPDRIAVMFPTRAGMAVDDPDAPPLLEAVLTDLRQMGDHVLLRFRLANGEELLARRPPTPALQRVVPGQTAVLAWQPGQAIAFPFRGEMG